MTKPTKSTRNQLRDWHKSTHGYTDINSEDRLVQKTFADHLEQELGWENVFAWNDETFGSDGTLGRDSTKDVVLKRDLRRAVSRLNPELPASAVEDVISTLTQHDVSRSLMAHNQTFMPIFETECQSAIGTPAANAAMLRPA